MNIATAALKRFSSYFREVREEMQKVSWPSKEQATRYSIVVVAVSLSIAVFFILLDQLFNLGLQQLLKI